MQLVIGAAGSLDPEGPSAEIMADLWWFMLAIGTAVFVLFLVLLVGGLFRRRGQQAEDPDDRRTVMSRWLVGGGIVMPSVVLAVVFGATLVAMRALPASTADAALEVELIGHQWWYEVRYPDHGFETANEVHIPVGRPVRFHVTSADVIHSFWVPALGGKIDMLPDGPNTMVLQANESGVHRSQCAEFCGLQHTRMGMVVVAESPDEFTAWTRRQQGSATAPDDAQARRGRDLFAANCAECHGVDGSRPSMQDGPTLTHLASRRTLAAGMLDNTEDNLRAWVTDPQGIKPGVDMPAADLTPEELDDLIAYLMGLQ